MLRSFDLGKSLREAQARDVAFNVQLLEKTEAGSATAAKSQVTVILVRHGVQQVVGKDDSSTIEFTANRSITPVTIDTAQLEAAKGHAEREEVIRHALRTFGFNIPTLSGAFEAVSGDEIPVCVTALFRHLFVAALTAEAWAGSSSATPPLGPAPRTSSAGPSTCRWSTPRKPALRSSCQVIRNLPPHSHSLS